MKRNYQERKSNITVWGVPVFLGITIMIVTFGLTAFFKNNLIDIYRKANPLLPHTTWDAEIKILELDINGNRVVIDSERSFLKMEKVIPNSDEVSSQIKQKKRNDKIKGLEDKNAELLLQKEELEKKKQASIGQPTGNWDEDYNLDGLTLVVCLGILTSLFAFMTFFDKFKPIKDNYLTLFERKADCFFFMSIVGSLFGFSLFMWYVTITY